MNASEHLEAAVRSIESAKAALLEIMRAADESENNRIANLSEDLARELDSFVVRLSDKAKRASRISI
jgi:hypothetical protein